LASDIPAMLSEGSIQYESAISKKEGYYFVRITPPSHPDVGSTPLMILEHDDQ